MVYGLRFETNLSWTDGSANPAREQTAEQKLRNVSQILQSVASEVWMGGASGEGVAVQREQGAELLFTSEHRPADLD